jgi:hypothetical protein
MISSEILLQYHQRFPILIQERDFFFAIVGVEAMEEEDANVVLLSTPITALELEAAVSPMMREV